MKKKKKKVPVYQIRQRIPLRTNITDECKIGLIKENPLNDMKAGHCYNNKASYQHVPLPPVIDAIRREKQVTKHSLQPATTLFPTLSWFGKTHLLAWEWLHKLDLIRLRLD